MSYCWRYMPVVALLTAALLLAAACDEEETTPTATPAATVTGTSEATATSTPSPAGEVPGITDTEIILGLHGPLSGTWGAAYAPVVNGVEAFFRYLNAEEGGVCGRDVILKVEDDQYLPSGAVEAVKKLVERDEVFAIVGSIGTAAHSAVWEDLNEKGIPDLWILSGAHKFGSEPDKYPWSLPILPDYFIEGTIFGRYISENMPGKKVGILYQNDDWGEDVLNGLRNGLDPDKNELVSEQSYEITAVTVRSQVANLKNAGAEVVVSASNPGGTAQLIKEADRLGWHPQFFVDYVNSSELMFLYASPELMEGVITLQANKPSYWTDDPAVAEHHRIQSKYGDHPPSNFTTVGYGVGAVTRDALAGTCDNLTREGLMDSIHTNFRDYLGDLSMPGMPGMTITPTDHFATEAMMLLQARVVDGKGRWEYMSDEILYFREE
jgi:branched-chain amino acid transport system substrate-binding protein